MITIAAYHKCTQKQHAMKISREGTLKLRTSQNTSDVAAQDLPQHQGWQEPQISRPTLVGICQQLSMNPICRNDQGCNKADLFVYAPREEVLRQAAWLRKDTTIGIEIEIRYIQSSTFWAGQFTDNLVGLPPTVDQMTTGLEPGTIRAREASWSSLADAAGRVSLLRLEQTKLLAVEYLMPSSWAALMTEQSSWLIISKKAVLCSRVTLWQVL